MTDETRLLGDNDLDAGTLRSADGPLVSVFTATHDIEREIDTAFRSLLRQTYPQWEWVIVDDSSQPETSDYIAQLADTPAADGRIRLYRQHPLPHSVGASKAAAAALCRGKFIVELDHDDELMPNALELVAATFVAHPDVDFVYSDWIDWIDEPDGADGPGSFPPGWGFGFGGYATEMVGGRRVPVTLSPPITWETIRHIVAMPNHLRAWRTAFYRRIGGHDHRLPVADDYELMVRTFLHGMMAHIPRPLYIQHHSPAGTNTSRRRNAEIQQRVEQIAAELQTSIDRRCLSRGMSPRTTPPWSAEPIAMGNARIDVIAEAAASKKAPLVSVVVPTYGRPDLLHRAIASALQQTYTSLEVLVVGDACPDVDKVVAGIADARVRHWNLADRSDDLGATPRNYALKAMARGTLVAYLDDDNWWDPGHLASLVDLLIRDPLTSFAFSSFTVAGETIECRRPRRFQIDTSALLHRRFLPERCGFWRSPSAVDWAHDWEFVSRWDDEPWQASLQSTVHYTLETSHQDLAAVRVMKAAAEEERLAALARSGE
ncbi:MAG: glycosyltransferase family 2 protein [Thermomicrobiales bacterium]